MISRRERVMTYTLLAIVSIAVLFPLVWVLFQALSPSSVGAVDLTHLQWSNFVTAWQQAGFTSYLKSSLIITGSVVVIGTLVAILSGYAFGVLGVTGEKVLFPVVLLGLMLPMEAFIVPLYYDFLDYRITDTYQGIVLAHLGMGVSFGAFWMRTAFKSVPDSLGEAARIDGAGSWAQLWRVYLPLARPAVLTLVLLSFLWTWNDYFLALVIVSDPAHQPITLGLGAFSGRYLVQINLLSAAAILVSLPIIVLSFIFQRQFVRGMLSGSVKG
jgi:raffinose/stachyose/melibiose transport system permease protein